MNVLIIKSAVLNSQQSENFSRSRGSIAKWSTIDGKLVCKWFPVEYQEAEL
ncbi:hypothetical protein H6F89_24705 [Cyanobacteria bacterium FACHB-63]|nr:hypothetical protein [Cyanobacteria bacterium FACHB-63]